MTHFAHCGCYDCMRSRRRQRRISIALWLVVLGIGLLLLAMGWTGCSSTVTPTAVHASQASYDGTAQNSGIISAQPHGFVVTAHFRDRYNALIELYGRDFLPALTRDAGLLPLTDTAWLIDAEHMVKFLQMNTWKKSGRAPSHP